MVPVGPGSGPKKTSLGLLDHPAKDGLSNKADEKLCVLKSAVVHHSAHHESRKFHRLFRGFPPEILLGEPLEARRRRWGTGLWTLPRPGLPPPVEILATSAPSGPDGIHGVGKPNARTPPALPCLDRDLSRLSSHDLNNYITSSDIIQWARKPLRNALELSAT